MLRKDFKMTWYADYDKSLVFDEKTLKRKKLNPEDYTCFIGSYQKACDFFGIYPVVEDAEERLIKVGIYIQRSPNFNFRTTSELYDYILGLTYKKKYYVSEDDRLATTIASVMHIRDEAGVADEALQNAVENNLNYSSLDKKRYDKLMYFKSKNYWA